MENNYFDICFQCLRNKQHFKIGKFDKRDQHTTYLKCECGCHLNKTKNSQWVFNKNKAEVCFRWANSDYYYMWE